MASRGVRLDPQGISQWNSTLPFSEDNFTRQVIQTSDRGFVIVSEKGVLKDLAVYRLF
jgi:hypothetical protein